MMQRVQVHVEFLYPWRYYEVYAIVVRTVLIIGGRGIIGEKIGPGGYMLKYLVLLSSIRLYFTLS